MRGVLAAALTEQCMSNILHIQAMANELLPHVGWQVVPSIVQMDECSINIGHTL